MSLLSKTLKNLKKHKISKGSRPNRGYIAKTGSRGGSHNVDQLSAPIGMNRASRGSSSPSIEDVFVEVEGEKINISRLDFELASLRDDEINAGERSFMSFNPLTRFSHHIDIDLKRLDEMGFITPRYANSQLSNIYRMIKRPLLNNALGKNASVVNNGNMIVITSSFPGEGKTFSAINLAMSIAMEKDKHVLLVDADVNKPSHPSIFGIETRYGLTDVLMGRVDDLSSALYKTNIPSLTLMSAGKPTPSATELLASEDMHLLVQDISSRYPDRIVIFDSPPLLMTTEASVLASHMGQVVVVVEAENTLRHQVKKSMSLLQNEIVLMLLNKMRDKSDMGSYGYYGYGHNT